MLKQQCAIVTVYLSASFLFAPPPLLSGASTDLVDYKPSEASWDEFDDGGNRYESLIADSAEMNGSQPKTEALGQDHLVFNSPNRPTAQNGWNLWVRGDALFWRASEDNLFYAYSGNDLGGSRNRDVRTVDFDWEWGFRLGMGYTIPRDRWDLAFYWTRFHTSSHSNVSINYPEEIFINWWVISFLNDVGITNSAHGHWKANLDQLDLSLGREFFVGRHLTLRPHAGLRSAWIDQQLTSTFHTTTGSTVSKMKNDFWGFGFFGGLDTKWMLSNSWHIFANGDLALLYGNFDISVKGKVNNTPLFSIDDGFHAGRAVADLQAGVCWSHSFHKDRLALTFRAGYEYHLYPNQNQLPLPVGNSGFQNTLNPVDGDLAYQGLFLSGQMDF
ncbi:MAG: hypothetical protein JSR39_03005 [Verrucomicrobia bacterium]|nr:hypothetical protein [Verrucomicrobiota bacterium]